MRDRPQTPAVDTGLADRLTALASQAAAAILAIRPSMSAARLKQDRSPVTAADEASDLVIAKGLSQILPGIPLVSEETNTQPRIAPGTSFVLVDPLDGTKEFLTGTSEFTVNIALVIDGRPAVGFISAPALGLLYRGIVGRGAERLRLAPGAPPAQASEVTAIRTRLRPAEGLVATVSRSHLEATTEAFLQRLPVVSRLSCGSALKFCRIAEGSADIYPRLSPTSEWDVAAGHALVTAAGGFLTGPDGRPLSYGRAEVDFRIPAFVAWGDPAAAPKERRS
jgi:3'(2'), 5'-bisphosphate nucleotidase